MLHCRIGSKNITISSMFLLSFSYGKRVEFFNPRLLLVRSINHKTFSVVASCKGSDRAMNALYLTYIYVYILLNDVIFISIDLRTWAAFCSLQRLLRLALSEFRPYLRGTIRTVSLLFIRYVDQVGTNNKQRLRFNHRSVIYDV